MRVPAEWLECSMVAKKALMIGWAGLLGLTTFGAACLSGSGNGTGEPPAPQDSEREERLRMVATQIEARGITAPTVLEAMRSVPRHLYVPASERPYAYTDGPLSIGQGQTISQPYIVALMTELIRPKRSMKVLEVGTGSGYQAAVLAECVGEVYSIEIVPELGHRAEELLRQQGYRNVQVRVGDGYDGWPEAAPFDAVLLTAAPEEIPLPLVSQLRTGGRLVAPVGTSHQELVVVTKTGAGLKRETITGVRFVPMTGKAEKKD